MHSAPGPNVIASRGTSPLPQPPPHPAGRSCVWPRTQSLTGRPQPSSPGLIFRLGVIIHQGLHAFLSHVSQHRECGLHYEVNETCRVQSHMPEVSWPPLGAQRSPGLASGSRHCDDMPPSHSKQPLPSYPHLPALTKQVCPLPMGEPMLLEQCQPPLDSGRTSSQPHPPSRTGTLTYLGLGHQSGGAITERREGQAQLSLLVTLWGSESGHFSLNRPGVQVGMGRGCWSK